MQQLHCGINDIYKQKIKQKILFYDEINVTVHH